MKKSTSGFTIVELLIVIVVIAILATISVVAYRGIQDRAIASAVRSDLANFAKKIELARVDTNDGLYPTALTVAMGFTATKSVYMVDGRSNWYYCTSPDRSAYGFGVVDIRNRAYYQTPEGVQEIAAADLNGATSCTMIGAAAYTGMSPSGYYWSHTTSTGAWQTWVR